MKLAIFLTQSQSLAPSPSEGIIPSLWCHTVYKRRGTHEQKTRAFKVCVGGGGYVLSPPCNRKPHVGIPQLPRGQCPERNQGNVKVLRRNSRFQAWCYTPVIPATRRLRQEAHEFNSPAQAEKLSLVNKYTTENGEMGQCGKSLQHLCGT